MRSRWRQGWTAGAVMAAALLVAPHGLGASSSTQPTPTVTFSTPGNKTVTLQACNEAGCTWITKTVVVLDPLPHITSAFAGAWSVQQGTPSFFSGTAEGRPPLTYMWRVKDSWGSTVAMLPGASVAWDTTRAIPGDYQGFLEVSNTAGTAVSVPVFVTVTPSASYIFADGFQTGTVGRWSRKYP